jgi:hypothetical protein
MAPATLRRVLEARFIAIFPSSIYLVIPPGHVKIPPTRTDILSFHAHGRVIVQLTTKGLSIGMPEASCGLRRHNAKTRDTHAPHYLRILVISGLRAMIEEVPKLLEAYN